ncbi:hypothetical protein PSTG_09485 [Puccinia striiformis f. sp. tritici PST-78]|uniref:Uncharacterized protein n=1 Tax=Puccinia striiformis f. sp. tritici PST-78 TaxID=1165861 RepID=A0A0L0VD56_9BASI|nr:hypothetical protein PSTG_09485 [Puccinia striiformis f. sp. tritici PST-78]
MSSSPHTGKSSEHRPSSPIDNTLSDITGYHNIGRGSDQVNDIFDRHLGEGWEDRLSVTRSSRNRAYSETDTTVTSPKPKPKPKPLKTYTTGAARRDLVRFANAFASFTNRLTNGWALPKHFEAQPTVSQTELASSDVPQASASTINRFANQVRPCWTFALTNSALLSKPQGEGLEQTRRLKFSSPIGGDDVGFRSNHHLILIF